MRSDDALEHMITICDDEDKLIVTRKDDSIKISTPRKKKENPVKEKKGSKKKKPARKTPKPISKKRKTR
jgi:hypothetical protein